ncbi:NAD-dependent epimerase/dehydratase family protein [Sporolactobacillus shoreae]|uniref:NAD-dependent epimerase/dehydratase family protein n=1 Tax=Sporolactobacillus shoreae TaxID=1465501 RepID=A0A4Z0GPY0_9BACL|nr:NAD-dependent epimerase/dehydratase family protein [Sporolactobacillus shoreae]TGA98459.1 NAD-dependent epimerase/dehydratase family protein [Sporolactobacillus shoreae]
MKIIITGGAGFIGSTILEEVIKNGWSPVVIDNLSTGSIKHIPDGVSFYNMDVCSPDIERVFSKEKPDVVIHEAAQVSVGYSQKYPLLDSRINVQGTINLMQLCVKYHVAKFIYASSAAVYGTSNRIPLEENTELHPISFYGLSKYTAEQYIRMFSESYGLNYTILRYANVYGMRQNLSKESGVISIFVDRLVKGEPITVFGDGQQTRDFVFVRDVARANVQAVLHGDLDTFNISSMHRITINQLIALLQKLSGRTSEISYQSARAGDIKDSALDNGKARRILQWDPMTEMESGLIETISYYKNLAGIPLMNMRE